MFLKLKSIFLFINYFYFLIFIIWLNYIFNFLVLWFLILGQIQLFLINLFEFSSLIFLGSFFLFAQEFFFLDRMLDISLLCNMIFTPLALTMTNIFLFLCLSIYCFWFEHESLLVGLLINGNLKYEALLQFLLLLNILRWDNKGFRSLTLLFKFKLLLFRNLANLLLFRNLTLLLFLLTHNFETNFIEKGNPFFKYE